jgi:hypothetical protein
MKACGSGGKSVGISLGQPTRAIQISLPPAALVREGKCRRDAIFEDISSATAGGELLREIWVVLQISRLEFAQSGRYGRRWWGRRERATSPTVANRTTRTGKSKSRPSPN